MRILHTVELFHPSDDGAQKFVKTLNSGPGAGRGEAVCMADAGYKAWVQRFVWEHIARMYDADYQRIAA